MAEKLLITGLALIAAVWLVGELKDTPPDGTREAMRVNPAQQAGSNYLPEPKPPDARDFRAQTP